MLLFVENIKSVSLRAATAAAGSAGLATASAAPIADNAGDIFPNPCELFNPYIGLRAKTLIGGNWRVLRKIRSGIRDFGHRLMPVECRLMEK